MNFYSEVSLLLNCISGKSVFESSVISFSISSPSSNAVNASICSIAVCSFVIIRAAISSGSGKLSPDCKLSSLSQVISSRTYARVLDLGGSTTELHREGR